MIYLVPGLGADHRIFENITLPGFETTVIKWEHPKKDERIEEYAKRLAAQVKHDAPVFIGLSFGGIIGAELTKLFPGSKLILISSIASRHEIPWFDKISAALRLNLLFPGTFMKRKNPIVRWFFSVNRGNDRELFDAILRDTDPDLLAWSVHTLLHWKGNANHRLHHIHGGKDRLLPVKCTSADIIIPDGGHFMIVSHGAEISNILIQILKKETSRIVV